MNWFVFAFGSSLFLSFSRLAEKKALIKEHAMEFCTVLALFNLILSIPFLLKWRFTFSFKIIGLIYLASICGTFAFLFLAKAMRHMEISSALPLMTIGPAVTAILAFIILREKLSFYQLIGIAFLILGTYILQLTAKKHDFFEPFKVILKSKYIHYIFLALLLYGIGSIIDRYVLNQNNGFNVSPQSFLFIAHLFLAINFVLLMFLFHDGFAGIKRGIKSNSKWVFLMAVLITSSRLLQQIAITIPLANVALVVAIRRTSAFFSTLIGGELFHDHGMKRKIMACFIMLIGVYFIIF